MRSRGLSALRRDPQVDTRWLIRYVYARIYCLTGTRTGTDAYQRPWNRTVPLPLSLPPCIARVRV